MSKSLLITPDKCTGCMQCELACSWVQTGTFQPSRSVIRVNIFDEEASYAPYTAYTRPANMAGTPAIAVPIPLVDAPPSLKHLRASIQLMGPPHSEALLVSTARRIEAAVRP